MTDSVEIPTANSGFLTITSSRYTDAQNVYIAISGYHSLPQWLGDSLFNLAVVENPRFAVGISILSAIVPDI